ncbi:NCK-interacting protein with SH3 domain [Pseudolycoriella hygida]|uniref:NCK-interacting protein with SH3 domain n=1 Tax=Pseudolycoriella hygida TaxID=35572 RepID=A0A9Q0MVP3_9DIPT|nr:NCK-interacting protein with SH3 domain [Pseudolycoriella hygida]
MEQCSSLVIDDSFEMLKALYDFQAVYPKTISFFEGEHFILHQTSVKQRNWWQVINMKGSIGFVPSNYVNKIKVKPSFLLGFLETVLEFLKLSKDEDINGIITRTELIERLEAKKTQVKLSAKALESDNDSVGSYENIPNGQIKTNDSAVKSSEMPSNAPPIKESPSITSSLGKPEELVTPSTAHDNSITSDPSEATNTISDDATVMIKTAKITQPKPASPSHSNEHTTQSSEKSKKCAKTKSEPLEVSQIEVYQILDSIRQTTNLSHELSCVALKVVLSELETIYSTPVLEFLEPIAKHFTAEQLSAPDEFIEHTHDSHRLKLIFGQLDECKNDSEQRTWMLHEDEDYIVQFLTELIEILKNADKKVCRFELSCDQYQSIYNLIQYYQMETRWRIKTLILQAFKALCYLDKNAVEVLLMSVLPLELVNDIKCNSSDLDRLKDVTLMLTMIYATGLKMPTSHPEHIGTKFILFILDIIETPPEGDVLEIIPDIMINLILSLNLQFDNFTDNFILSAMQKISSAKTFTEKILVLLNREEDPLNIFDHSTPPINSVLKMFVDLFIAPETANLFYTNDNKVLIDILVRQLSDLSAGDPLRRWYLELCRRIVRNTNYAEHSHRKSDLMKIFTRIFCEETECSLKDQKLVREIANEFPQIFKA